MIRLLIADDEDLVRSALAALLALEDDLAVVAEASASTEAVRLAREFRPDIAVLDLEMPPPYGLRAAEEIGAELPTRVVLVTRHARPAVLRRALSAGVRGFVPETTPAARLAEIIRDVAAGRRYVDPDIAASALTEDDCSLSDRELQVLRAARTGASVAEIAVEVHLAQGTGTGTGTVRNYLSAAMSEPGAPTRHAAAHHAWQQGWIRAGNRNRSVARNRSVLGTLSTRPARTASPWPAASRTRLPRPRSFRRG